ncbi:hypothetical protein ACFLXM_00100 [Chloroflexota bacterium]
MKLFQEVMKWGAGLDAGILGHGMDMEYFMGMDAHRGYGYGYPWGAMSGEEELAILEEQEICLSGE